MYLTLNIQNITQPVIKETRLVSFFTGVLERFSNRLIKRYFLHINTLIFTLEGVLQRIDEIDKLQAEKGLREIEKAIKVFDKMNSDWKKINYFDNKEFETNYNYMLQCLYTIESRLHKKVYSSKSFEKTPEDIRTGIMRMNALYTQKLLLNDI